MPIKRKNLTVESLRNHSNITVEQMNDFTSLFQIIREFTSLNPAVLFLIDDLKSIKKISDNKNVPNVNKYSAYYSHKKYIK
jgi:hypothetical protein